MLVIGERTTKSGITWIWLLYLSAMDSTTTATPHLHQPPFWRRTSSMPIVPLALFACTLVGIFIIPSWPLDLEYYLSSPIAAAPIFGTLFVSVFTILYTYKAIRDPIRIGAQVVAWTLALAAIAAFVYLIWSGDQSCTFIGLPCNYIHQLLIVQMGLVNPFVELFLCILAVAGSIYLFLPLKR